MAPLARGDLIQIEWVDIFEDAGGNPDEAKLYKRISYGLFWTKRQDDGVSVVVTTTTLDEADHSQQGYCIYPEACIRSLKIIKRARRKK